MGAPKGQRTMESWMIANGETGQSFYSPKMDKSLTAIATHHKRKILTERVLIVTSAKANPQVEPATKVTLL